MKIKVFRYDGTYYEVDDPGIVVEPDTIVTVDERVRILESENELLKAQVEAQSQQMDFYEECIAEMACVVYA